MHFVVERAARRAGEDSSQFRSSESVPFGARATQHGATGEIQKWVQAVVVQVVWNENGWIRMDSGENHGQG